MSNFSIGGEGGGERLPKARGLPEGTVVEIVSCSVEKSKFERTIRSGTRAGQKEPTLQLKVVYEAVSSGTTVAYRTSPPNGTPVEVPATAFSEGDRFVQYLGGVYPKDNGGVTFTKTGSAFAFIEALREAGATIGDKTEDFVGLNVTVIHQKGRGPAGPYVQAMPGKIVSATSTAPKAATTAPGTVATSAPRSAFDALSKEDQKTVLDALAAGPVSAEELVDSGFATDKAHAEAILGSVPVSEPAPKKSLLRKA